MPADLSNLNGAPRRVVAPAGMVVIIGIAGMSAAGKTHIARHLAKQLGAIGLTVAIVSQDLYYKKINPADGPAHNWDDPGTIDFAAMAAGAARLKSGRQVWLPHHDYITYAQEDHHTYQAPANVVILEGLFVLHDELLRPLLDYRIYVECREELALARRYNRDIAERGYLSEAVKDRYKKYVRPAYERFIAPSRERADLVIENSAEDDGFARPFATVLEFIKGCDAARLA